MKNVVLVAAHFTPSNLAAVHRSRLWTQHLREVGWNPIIVTTHYRHYEEALDWDLDGLVQEDLEVIRTAALLTRPLRLIGDIGVRGLAFHYNALAQLARQGRMDFLHITIPSMYSALLGRMVHSVYGTPYGIDYIDPWVHEWPGSEQRFSKAWTSARLGELLEPWAVRDASLITGVAPLYYEDVLERNPHLREQAVTAAMPYGGSESDFDTLRQAPRETFLFDPKDGRFHMMYAGAMLPRGYPILERLFQAMKILEQREPELAKQLHITFVGTGKSPSDPQGFNVQPYAERIGVADMVREYPARVPYVDVLNHLMHASATLIVGSTEPHYTPSKSFQGVQARRPMLALLHEASTAADFLQKSNAGTVVTLAEDRLPDPEALATTLARFMQDKSYDPKHVNWELFEEYSARSTTRVLGRALDEAYARSRRLA
jgi:hypothetical protein